MSATIARVADNHISVSGTLDFVSVPNLCNALKSHLNGNPLTVDLSGVNYSNSAGLALLTDWLRQAKREQQSITFVNPPNQMEAIAKVCGLQNILGFNHADRST